MRRAIRFDFGKESLQSKQSYFFLFSSDQYTQRFATKQSTSVFILSFEVKQNTRGNFLTQGRGRLPFPLFLIPSKADDLLTLWKAK